MTDGDLRDQIARLESDIEHLAEGLERCRKAMLFSKVAIGAGGVCILAYFLGIRLDPTIVVGALAAIIGGVVVLGSNSSTSKQTMAAMKAGEAQRAELIGMINLRRWGRAGAGPFAKQRFLNDFNLMVDTSSPALVTRSASISDLSSSRFSENLKQFA